MCCNESYMNVVSFSLKTSYCTIILTFSLKGNTLSLLFGMPNLPAPVLFCFGAISKQNKGFLNTSLCYPDS